MVRKAALVLIVGVVAALAVVYARRHWFGPFDPDRIAASETRMWQTYYTGDAQALGREMVGVLRDQFRLLLGDAIEIGKDLAGAAMTFQGLSSGYDRVLPSLEQAYGRIKERTGGTWDASAAARAEFDWWVARRTPGRDSPEQVGHAIARLYALLYGKSNAEIERAGLLRAQACALRDRGGAQADWAEVQRLLRQSYRALCRGIRQ